MMLAWIKRNKYLMGFLIAVIAIGYFGYGYYKSSTEVKETVRTATVEYGPRTRRSSISSEIAAKLCFFVTLLPRPPCVRIMKVHNGIQTRE